MGRLTLPNFLIVGAAKSGTTSLHQYLAQHPEVYMSKIKEPQYFVHGLSPKWAVRDLLCYSKLFEGADGCKAIGESSTAYLPCEASPGLIHKTLGDVKIIIMLRNPSLRAFSMYGWMVMEGYETARTFREALELEEERVRSVEFREWCPNYLPEYLYYRTGLYHDQVKRYLDEFPAGHVRMFLFEDFIKAPVETCQEVFRFLGVDAGFKPEIKVHNKSRIPYSPRLQWRLRKIAEFPTYWFPNPVRRLSERLMDLNIARGRTVRIPADCLAMLDRRYRPGFPALQELTGLDVQARWGPKVA
jgi:hypothetical protein